MSGNEGGSANPVDSVGTHQKARPAVRKHQKNWSSSTAARACAARLMAPGAGLEIPSFREDAWTRFARPAIRKGSCWRALCFRRELETRRIGRIRTGTPFNLWYALWSEQRSGSRGAPSILWRISTSRWEPTRSARVGEIPRRTRAAFSSVSRLPTSR
jgi:hypothetical protein